MRTFLRTLLYSLAVLFVLGYATVRVYLHPSQVRARLAGEISRLVAKDVVLEGCEERFLGALQLARILVPAAPQLAEPTFLELSDVRLEEGGPRRVFRRQRSSDGSAPRPALHVEKASLFVDHESPVAGRASASRWNFDELFRLNAIREHLESRHTRILIDELRVKVKELRPPADRLEWTFDVTEVEGRTVPPAGLVLDAELPEGEHWAGGHAELSWSQKEGFHARGRVEDLRGIATWLPLVGERARLYWDALRPEGSLNLDLTDLREVAGGGMAFRATVEHYDTRLRVGATGLELRRLTGSMAVTEAGIRLGKESAGSPVSAELLGFPVEVEGTVGEGGADARFTMAATALDSLGPGDGKGGSRLFAGAFERFRPRGTIEGACAFALRPGEKETMSGSLRFHGVTAENWAGLASSDGTLIFESSSAQAAGAQPVHAGKGKLVLEKLSLVGLPPASGEVRLEWDAKEMKVELSDVKVGLAAGGGADSRQGTVIASARWEWGQGLVALEGRWLDLAVETAFLRVARLSGALRVGGAVEGGTGSADLVDVVVPAGGLAPDLGDLKLASGRCVLAEADAPRWHVDVRSLKLVGEGLCVRARGTVTASGALDWIVLVCQGAAAGEVERLPDASGPAAWRDAARGAYRAFRVSGTFMAPRSREVGALDSAFGAEGERGK